MGNLMVSLRNAAGAMEVFQRGMGVVQTNVANASTPGWARQTQVLTAKRTEFETGLAGGVSSGGTDDSRDALAEANVRAQLHGQGAADARAQQLGQLDQIFSVSQDSGINGALNKLMSAFSAATVSPNDGTARQNILSQAANTAYAFNTAATDLTTIQTNADRSITNTVNQINAIGAKIVEINKQMRSDFRSRDDAGLQSQLYGLLDELAQVTDFTLLPGSDGSANVYIGGQTPLTIGDKEYALQADTSSTPARLLSAQGDDITAQLGSGSLSALYDVRNNVVPGQLAQLDRLAQSVADTVNATLAGGVDQNGAAPMRDLFHYDTTSGVARTLAVNDLAPSELALASSTAPGGNAVALQLAGLADAPSIDNLTFGEFYGNLAASAGRLVSSATSDQTTKAALVTQAKQLRDDQQSVSLNEEALTLMQFQRAYQASAKMVQTLNDILDTVIGMLR